MSTLLFFYYKIMEYIKSLGTIFQDSLSNVWGAFATFIPIVLLAIILFVVGMLIAGVVGRAVAQVISITKVDKLFESAGVSEFLAKAGLKLDIGKFFGVIVKWFIAIVFLMASLQVVQLTEVSRFIGEMVFLSLPKVLIIAIVLILATIIADFVKNFVLASAKAANIKSASSLASIAKYAIWIFAFSIILPQLGIDDKLIQIFWGGVMGVIAISFGLAFGLGGKEAAARAIDKITNDLSSK